MKQRVFDTSELNERIELNFNRLQSDAYYQIGDVFAPADYEWYGDKEGRALLAFVSHYKISGRKIPCMDEMMREMAKHCNAHLFFGPLSGEIIHEQQLSGHSWLLRGLCEYHEQFGDAFSLEMIRSIWKNLYLPTKGRYASYPVDRTKKEVGGVSGESIGVTDSWKLSSDIGCAFMSIDGLSHAYELLGDAELKEMLDEMIEVYRSIDKYALRVQTHCTLTAARGMMRLYRLTKEQRYLDAAKEIYVLYTEGGGMTYTYQNVNWWGRNDTWTEPCAIVDSLMLACELYFAEGNEDYRKMAARIYHNGLATSQRANGGAGTDSVVTAEAGGSAVLYSKKYEAYFCCTMRLSEGLWYADLHKDLLYAETEGEVRKQENGVYADGDLLYAKIEGGDKYLTQTPVTVDGITLHPILKYFRIPKEDMDRIRQQIIFD